MGESSKNRAAASDKYNINNAGGMGPKLVLDFYLYPFFDLGLFLFSSKTPHVALSAQCCPVHSFTNNFYTSFLLVLTTSSTRDGFSTTVSGIFQIVFQNSKRNLSKLPVLICCVGIADPLMQDIVLYNTTNGVLC